MKKKRAFTMVELIFVIVILGILAAVAVPKLNASRTDAQMARLKANLVTLAKDFETYYAANGNFCTPKPSENGECFADLTKITSVPFDGFRIHPIIAYFELDGKECLEISAGESPNNLQHWYVVVHGTDGCPEKLKNPIFDDIKYVFWGFLNSNKGTYEDPGDPREQPGRYSRHWMNDPSRSVEW